MPINLADITGREVRLDCSRAFRTLLFDSLTLFLLIVLQPFGMASSGPTLAALPIVFETNMGQVPSSYQYVSRHGYVETLFSATGVDILLPDGSRGSSRIGFHLLGAAPEVRPEARYLLPSVSHYLLESDSSRWIHAVPHHAQVVYPEVYPGIDLVFHGNGDELEHDFRVSPGSDPARVRFSIAGATSVSLADSGDLKISLASGTLVFHKPLAFQDSPRGRQMVESSFVLNSDNTVQFCLGAYDISRELTIDPVFGFSTYLAGNTADYTAAVTSDSGGNVYVTGYTYSSAFPIVDGLEATYDGSPDAFVSKLDPTGHSLLYSTYLGGSSRNYGNAIAVDSKVTSSWRVHPLRMISRMQALFLH